MTRLAATLDVQAWLVGGTVRDALLGRRIADIDLAVGGDGRPLARALADHLGGAYVELDPGRGVGRAVLGALVIDCAALRGPGIVADLQLRDFSVNAIAVPLEGSPEPIDPCGGLADLAARRMRACGPTSLHDDPLRLLRAPRLAAMLGLALDRELDAQIRAASSLVARPAPERVRDELLKLLATSCGAWGLRYLDDTRLLTTIIPELEPARSCDQPIVHFLPVLAHSLEAVTAIEWLAGQILGEPAPARPPEDARIPAPAVPVAVQTLPDLRVALPFVEQLRMHLGEQIAAGMPRIALLKLATLLHDVAKPQTRADKPEGGVSFHGHQELGAEIARVVALRLKLSRDAAAYIAGLVRAHMRPGQLAEQGEVTLRAIHRLFRDVGRAGPDVLLHSLADHMATRGPRLTVAAWEWHLAFTATMLEVEYGVNPVPARPLLRGEEVMAALGIGPGPEVGRLLSEIQEARAAGEIETRDEALALIRALHQA